jgi:hypothetical protein
MATKRRTQKNSTISGTSAVVRHNTCWQIHLRREKYYSGSGGKPWTRLLSEENKWPFNERC